MPKILAFAGSYREHSYNKRVLAVAAEGARVAGAEVTTIDLRDFPMPIFCADGIENGEFDANALKLQDLFAEHDGEIGRFFFGGLDAAVQRRRAESGDVVDLAVPVLQHDWFGRGFLF